MTPMVGLSAGQTVFALQAPQQGSSSKATVQQADAEELLLKREQLELEKQKLASSIEIEKEKLALESHKVDIETSILRSVLAPAVPLIIGLLTLVYSIWSFRRQARQQASMQLESAKLQFEVKAAEIAFSRETARAVVNRAKALQKIFPNRLPAEFASDFAPEEFGANKEPSEEKKFLLELLLKYPTCRLDTLNFWKALFPGDEEWLQRIESLINRAKSARSG